MTDEPTVREHSDEWCIAIERERLAKIAELQAAVASKQAAWNECEDAGEQCRARIADLERLVALGDERLSIRLVDLAVARGKIEKRELRSQPTPVGG